jgi:serine/threonine protein phosphatase PrpC
MNTWHSGAATDTGLLRDRNEDRYWVDAERGVFLVVDGVGGHAAGELAAETAVDAIRDSIFQEAGTVEKRVRRAITLANNRIFELAQWDDELRGMACVLTLVVVEGRRIVIGHVGDSRLYLIANGAIRKLTSDHSPVGEGEDAGELTEQEAMAHPRRHEVFRDVGSSKRHATDEDFIEIRHCRFRADAAILIMQRRSHRPPDIGRGARHRGAVRRRSRGGGAPPGRGGERGRRQGQYHGAVRRGAAIPQPRGDYAAAPLGNACALPRTALHRPNGVARLWRAAGDAGLGGAARERRMMAGAMP